MIIDRYDLKGSTYKRDSANFLDPNITKKDNDFLKSKCKINLNKIVVEQIISQISQDSNFLKSINVIDYSLLLGICDNGTTPRNKIINNKINSNNEFTSQCGNFVYYIGIIDTLTEFNFKKKGEFIFKSIAQGSSISCKPPKEYCERFNIFMKKVFNHNPPLFLTNNIPHNN